MKTLIMFLAAATCCGCLHTREIDPGAQPDAEAQPEEKKEEPQKAPPTAKKKEATPPTTSADARPPVEEGRPELSVSPQGLMLPEGPRLIQEALTKRGYLPADRQTGKLDKETSAALRKFQGEQELAKTGAPDRETVRRLGLSVEKVFRSSNHPRPNA